MMVGSPAGDSVPVGRLCFNPDTNMNDSSHFNRKVNYLCMFSKLMPQNYIPSLIRQNILLSVSQKTQSHLLVGINYLKAPDFLKKCVPVNLEVAI